MSLFSSVGAQLMRVPGASFAVRNPVLTEVLGLSAAAGGVGTMALLSSDDGAAGQARTGTKAIGT